MKSDYLMSRQDLKRITRDLLREYESGEPVPERVSLRVAALGGRRVDTPLAGGTHVRVGRVRLWAPATYRKPAGLRVLAWLRSWDLPEWVWIGSLGLLAYLLAVLLWAVLG